MALYSRDKLLTLHRYRARRDLLAALLEPGRLEPERQEPPRLYSLDEADELIKEFMAGQ